MHQTYTPGYELRPNGLITKNDIVNLCESLEQIFGNGYTFRPELITEGGIEFVDWPGKRDREYKSMRLGLDSKNWPNIDDQNTVMGEWRNNTDVITNSNMRSYTYLKAFNGAPCWTKDELRQFVGGFNSINIKVVGISKIKRLRQKF